MGKMVQKNMAQEAAALNEAKRLLEAQRALVWVTGPNATSTDTS